MALAHCCVNGSPSYLAFYLIGDRNAWVDLLCFGAGSQSLSRLESSILGSSPGPWVLLGAPIEAAGQGLCIVDGPEELTS